MFCGLEMYIILNRIELIIEVATDDGPANMCSRESYTFWTPQAILGFGVLQLRVHWFGRLHFEVLASKVHHLHMLKNSVRVLFLL
jgi:hypothetical protein